MRSIGAILVLFSLAAPLVAQSELQSRDGRLSVVSGQHGPRVRNDRGYSNPLNIPEEVELSSLVGLRAGWLAAGDQQAGTRRDLYFRLLDSGGLKRLPAPPGQQAAFRRDPVLVADGEALRGVLWLEGDDRGSMSVKASDWLGITWGQPVSVSAPGSGSQLALQVALLADGSWLAVWSAYDGQDDEIMWSIGVDGSWTVPSALTANSVPDILPTVSASESGAFVAWNQYGDGEYRVVTSQLREGRWIEPRREALGTLHPEMLLLEDTPTLIFLDASAPRAAWRVQELDHATGTVRRRGMVEGDDSERPLLLLDQDGPYVEWPQSAVRKPIAWERQE